MSASLKLTSEGALRRRQRRSLSGDYSLLDCVPPEVHLTSEWRARIRRAYQQRVVRGHKFRAKCAGNPEVLIPVRRISRQSDTSLYLNLP